MKTLANKVLAQFLTDLDKHLVALQQTNKTDLLTGFIVFGLTLSEGLSCFINLAWALFAFWVLVELFTLCGDPVAALFTRLAICF